MAAQRWFFAVCLLVAATVSARAQASANYPANMRTDLGLAAQPACTLCHRSDVGGIGTVVTPFGRTLMNRYGLTAGNVNGLEAALTGDDGEHFDSDGDGIPDIDELKAGMDPNVGMSGAPPPSDVPLPQTGCAFAPHSPVSALSSLVAVCAGLAFFGRRSRRAGSLTRT